MKQVSNQSVKQHAKKLLDKLRELDYQTVEAYYDMGSILSSIKHGKLYEALEYNSFTHLIEEELTYTPSTAFKYANMFNHFRRLHYNKAESIKLLQKFGLSHMIDVLPGMKDKIGQRAIKARIDNLDQHQINFTLTNAELNKTHKALMQMGAEQTEHGRWLNSSEAFMEMVNEVLKNKSPKLRVVK